MLILIESAPVPDFVPTATGQQPAAVCTVREAATRLRCSGQHVLDLIGRGQLRAVREGHRWLVLPADLDAYLAALRPAVAAAPAPPITEIKRERAQRRTA